MGRGRYRPELHYLRGKPSGYVTTTEKRFGRLEMERRTRPE